MRSRLQKKMLGLLLAGLLLFTPALALAATLTFSGIDDFFDAQLEAIVTVDDGGAVTGASFTINGGTPIIMGALPYAQYIPGVSLSIGGNDPVPFSIDYYCVDPLGANSMTADVDGNSYFVSAANLSASGNVCVPLPGSFLLLGAGLVGLLGLRRK